MSHLCQIAENLPAEFVQWSVPWIERSPPKENRATGLARSIHAKQRPHHATWTPDDLSQRFTALNVSFVKVWFLEFVLAGTNANHRRHHWVEIFDTRNYGNAVVGQNLSARGKHLINVLQIDNVNQPLCCRCCLLIANNQAIQNFCFQTWFGFQYFVWNHANVMLAPFVVGLAWNRRCAIN